MIFLVGEMMIVEVLTLLVFLYLKCIFLIMCFFISWTSSGTEWAPHWATDLCMNWKLMFFWRGTGWRSKFSDPGWTFLSNWVAGSHARFQAERKHNYQWRHPPFFTWTAEEPTGSIAGGKQGYHHLSEAPPSIAAWPIDKLYDVNVCQIAGNGTSCSIHGWSFFIL